MKTNYYYYDPVTGVFLQRSNYLKTDISLPYIEKPEGWLYCDYRVDVATGNLIHQPYTRPPKR